MSEQITVMMIWQDRQSVDFVGEHELCANRVCAQKNADKNDEDDSQLRNHRCRIAPAKPVPCRHSVGLGRCRARDDSPPADGICDGNKSHACYVSKPVWKHPTGFLVYPSTRFSNKRQFMTQHKGWSRKTGA